MSVKKVGKVWSFRIDAGVDPRTGKRKQIYRSGFKTKREALDEMAKLQLQVSTGEYTEPEKTLFNEYIESWLYKTYKHEVQLPTYEKAEPIVRYHLIPHFKSTPLSKITTYDIDQFYAAKLQEGLANATVRKMHNLLSKALQKAVKWGLIKSNPARDATPPTVHKQRKQTWTVEEAKTFLEVCEREGELIPFLLAIFTGMRRGELLALRCNNINLEKGVIHVVESLVRMKEKGLYVKTVKSAQSVREVFLSPNVRDALVEFKKDQVPNKLGIVIASSVGTYMEPRNLLRKYRRLIKLAGVPYMPFHNLRHTHATILMRMGKSKSG